MGRWCHYGSAGSYLRTPLKAELNLESSRKELVKVGMRDGAKLATYLFFPEGEGPWPAILVRHPYGKLYSEDVFETMAADGYVAILQDERGRFGSEGDWKPFEKSAEDGADTCDWIGKQSWSDGNVGLYGMSYAGGTQWLTAMESPKNLRAFAPLEAANVFVDFPYVSPGVIALGIFINWSISVAPDTERRYGRHPSTAEVNDLLRVHYTFEQTLDGFLSNRPSLDAGEDYLDVGIKMSEALNKVCDQPLSEFVKSVDDFLPWVREFLEHPDPEDDYWSKKHWTHRYDDIESPALIVAGWYDYFLQSGVEDFIELSQRDQGDTRHKLIVGPWGHGVVANSDQSVLMERQFEWTPVPDSWALGGSSQSKEPEMLKRWYDYWLKGEENGILDGAPVQIYVMGENVLRDEYEWPLARTEWTKFYLHSQGSANTLNGDGMLLTDKQGDQAVDQYAYDPGNPVPSLGGRQAIASGVMDQRIVEERDDVLVYSTDPLETAIEVTGPIKLKLWVSTSALDTDFTAKLVDVFPDGRAYNLREGVTRLRFRKEKPGLVNPGDIEEVTIDLGPTCNLFKKGHQIRLEVSSSNFPYFDPNPNTGKSLFLDESNEMIVAQQTVYHDDQRPSHLVLPVIPRS